MKWRGRRRSSNIGDQTGRGGGGFRMGRRGGGLPIGGKSGMGIGTLIVIGIVIWILGGNPLSVLGMGGGQPAVQQQAAPAAAGSGEGCERSEIHAFTCVVLADTEDVWNAEFAQQGADYPEPTLIFYAGRGQSGCGTAQSATGPFYCPADQRIYIDTSFFDQLAQMGGAGDFAAAYVVAHEVGHHIQTVTGISDRVRQMQARAGRTESNALQVKMELQADCYAGVFAYENREYLERGDIQEALAAANAIGDDRLQREAQGYVVPDSFTHGSSAQRQEWFQRGLQTGDPSSCDTFGA
ncbi:zinc metallopeptidase [Pacificimonas sp. WHA3]|uniref:Zinc metallopeptidase n=1 Tax=Pacificimonas pallii TaxID=2827236 RepID=A0ABS6SE10_9SPHN|nr:neutral zinc metallopeptidase [Pacificimonas pallii]MBV7256647.1 zinc metallopeptidase [Pacificimonas pallii]